MDEVVVGFLGREQVVESEVELRGGRCCPTGLRHVNNSEGAGEGGKSEKRGGATGAASPLLDEEGTPPSWSWPLKLEQQAPQENLEYIIHLQYTSHPYRAQLSVCRSLQSASIDTVSPK